MSDKKDKPFLGYAVKNGHFRHLSAKQILQFDDQHDGCPRKHWNQYVAGRRLQRPAYLEEGVSLAECLEIWLTKADMVLPPVLRAALRFLPDPKNEAGVLDLLCEQPLGDIAAALKIRDQVLAGTIDPSGAAVLIDRFAGVSFFGIPVDGAADWVHRRGTYKDKSGMLCREPTGISVVSVGDLKSTSQIDTVVRPSGTRQGWAQTDAEVVNDPQMVIYGKHRLKLYQDVTHARLEKVFAQKKPHAGDIRGGLASRQEIDDRFGVLGDRVVAEMIQTAQATNVSEVRAALGSCDAYSHMAPCGFPTCGEGVPIGQIPSTSGPVPCPHCKGKGRVPPPKGCGYRGTENCPEVAAQSQVPFSFASYRSGPISGEKGMSLFDGVEIATPVSVTTPDAPPVPPSAQANGTNGHAVSEQLPAINSDEFDAEVAREQAALEAELSQPLAVVSEIVAEISVMRCVQGEEYLVDCSDGHKPYVMKFVESMGGVFKFRDKLGAVANLKPTDKVVRQVAAPASVQVQVADTPPTPPVPPTGSGSAKVPCGAPGCGDGCAPGWVKSKGSSEGFLPCPGCAGKGAVSTQTHTVKPPDAPEVAWMDQQEKLSDAAIAEIQDPTLKALAIAHKAEVEKQEAEVAAANPTVAARGGNCPGSGLHVLFADPKQTAVLDSKVICPVCAAERPIPKEIKKAVPRPPGMDFPGHRKPKEETAPTPPAVMTTSPPAQMQLPVTDDTPPMPPSNTDDAPPVPPATLGSPPAASVFDYVALVRTSMVKWPQIYANGSLDARVDALMKGLSFSPGTREQGRELVRSAFRQVDAEEFLARDGGVVFSPTPDAAVLSKEDVDILSGLFRDRAQAIPRAALSETTLKLLQRLRLVDSV